MKTMKVGAKTSMAVVVCGRGLLDGPGFFKDALARAVVFKAMAVKTLRVCGGEQD